MAKVFSKRLAMPTRPRHRLGRHIKHDPRSWNFQAARRPIRSVLHVRHCPPFNQGNTNSCTGNAAAGLFMTTPQFRRGRVLTEGDALNIYTRATSLDPTAGTFPIKDPGSSGLDVMKAAQQLGLVRAYGHAFGLQHALEALTVGPVITGVYWYDSFRTPKRDGTITKRGHHSGGHEFLVVGLDVERQMLRACNSWGPDWGDGGFFQFSFDLWDELLHLHGDVTTATVAPKRTRDRA
jgi:hypothetical protein